MGDLSALFDEVPQEEQEQDTTVETPVGEGSPEGTEEEQTGTQEVGVETEAEEAGTEEQKGEEESPQEVTTKKTSESAPVESESELLALRALLRQQNQKLRLLEKQSQKTQKDLTEKGILEEPDEEEVQQRQAAVAMRASQLETILEIMRLNPRFEDVDSVVTQSRFDDMVEGFASVIAKEQGGNPAEIAEAVQAKIWSMANPYRFMYEKIKEHHPDFRQVGEEKPAPVPAPAAPTKKTSKPKTTPTTISKLAAGDADTQSGWTSARIDAMPEEDLGKVPRDVYEKYLSGQLK